MKAIKEITTKHSGKIVESKHFSSKEEAFKAKHEKANEFAKKVKFTF